MTYVLLLDIVKKLNNWYISILKLTKIDSKWRRNLNKLFLVKINKFGKYNNLFGKLLAYKS